MTDLRENVARAIAKQLSSYPWDESTTLRKMGFLQLADAAIRVCREHFAGVAEQKARDFLSPEYATGQPLSSFQERFACGQVASAIREDGK